FDLPKLQGAAKFEYRVAPARPSDGQVTVEENNVVWTPQLGLFRVPLAFKETTEAEISTDRGEVGRLLRKWYAAGTAAGNHGDLYDNRDSDHSNMNYKSLPQLTRVEYGEAARKRRLHHGLQRPFLFGAVTIGNSSTAVTGGAIWRSQPRLALTTPGGPA